MANYLVHSASNPQPDELYHFKYLKKYKVNGKWRYVYADNKTHKEMSNLNDQLNKADIDSLPRSQRNTRDYYLSVKSKPWSAASDNPRETYSALKDGSFAASMRKERRRGIDQRADASKKMDEIMKKNGISTRNMSKGKKFILNLLAIKG